MWSSVICYCIVILYICRWRTRKLGFATVISWKFLSCSRWCSFSKVCRSSVPYANHGLELLFQAIWWKFVQSFLFTLGTKWWWRFHCLNDVMKFRILAPPKLNPGCASKMLGNVIIWPDIHFDFLPSNGEACYFSVSVCVCVGVRVSVTRSLRTRYL